jgi:hypothetical protein
MPRFMDSEMSVVDCHLGTEGMKLGTERGRRVPGTSVRNPSVMSPSFSILSSIVDYPAGANSYP